MSVGNKMAAQFSIFILYNISTSNYPNNITYLLHLYILLLLIPTIHSYLSANFAIKNEKPQMNNDLFIYKDKKIFWWVLLFMVYFHYSHHDTKNVMVIQH